MYTFLKLCLFYILADLELTRGVKASTHTDFAKKSGLVAHFLSAKTGEGVSCHQTCLIHVRKQFDKVLIIK